jgi:hypothetical protein
MKKSYKFTSKKLLYVIYNHQVQEYLQFWLPMFPSLNDHIHISKDGQYFYLGLDALDEEKVIEQIRAYEKIQLWKKMINN